MREADALMRALGAFLAAVALAVPATAAAQDPPDPGRSEAFTYGANPYRVYTPASYDAAAKPVPLLVVVHGCNTTAEEQERANLQNRIAERERFVILYPDTPRRV